MKFWNFNFTYKGIYSPYCNIACDVTSRIPFVHATSLYILYATFWYIFFCYYWLFLLYFNWLTTYCYSKNASVLLYLWMLECQCRSQQISPFFVGWMSKETRADFSVKMVICSCHFFDQCFENSAFLKPKLTPHKKRLQIPDALPNSALKSKEFREPLQLK